jgi:hypothetical protein
MGRRSSRIAALGQRSRGIEILERRGHDRHGIPSVADARSCGFIERVGDERRPVGRSLPDEGVRSKSGAFYVPLACGGTGSMASGKTTQR